MTANYIKITLKVNVVYMLSHRDVQNTNVFSIQHSTQLMLRCIMKLQRNELHYKRTYILLALTTPLTKQKCAEGKLRVCLGICLTVYLPI
jgi:hypothetical protein